MSVTSATRPIEVDPALFTAKYGREPFALRHELADHPLFTLDALAELADALPEVEHNLGSVPEHLPGGVAPQADLTPGEIVRTIETNGCWAVLPVSGGEVPAYNDLLDELAEQVAPYVPGGRAAMHNQGGVVFLSAPGSVTPAHIDLEYGILFQLRAGKDITFGRFESPQARDTEVERFVSGGHRNVDKIPEDHVPFHLEPGDGVHVPPFYPHWIKTGDAVSISLNFSFRTPENLQFTRIHTFNGRARKLGLTPKAPGAGRPAADQAKATVVRGMSVAQRLAEQGRQKLQDRK